MRIATAAATLLLGSAACAQDWAKEVERACTSKRLGLQIAAANKVASGGPAAAEALREHAKNHGRNSLSLTLVGAVAANPSKPQEMLALLTEWARDKDFYWRAQALSGLARPDNSRLVEQRALFVGAVADPAHLYRIQGARGLIAIGTKPDRERARALLGDPDPRVRRAVAEHLADAGDKSALPALVETLRLSELEFLGDPWGRRESRLAFTALQRATAESCGYDPDKTAAENHAAIAAFARLAGMPPPAAAPASAPTSASQRARAHGVEIRSCKHGDLFVLFTDAGEITFGLEGTLRVTLPEAEALKVASVRKAITPQPSDTLGAVICDFARYQSHSPDLHWKCAPGALPEGLKTLLKTLAASLENTKQPELAEQMRLRLRQFVPQDDGSK